MASVLPATEEKAAYVQQMFSQIAATYDRTNRMMTFGLDQSWREHIVDGVAPPFNGRVLDVGTGTGDFLPMLATWMPHGMVVGIDRCFPMMHQGQDKLNGLYPDPSAQSGPTCVVSFAGGDALCLPFPDHCFDAITTGFTMRNVTDIGVALREMWRVTRPGGVLACLEVARPKNALLRLFHRLYFAYGVPWIGQLSSGNRRAYDYLYQSSRAFPPPDTLAAMMRDAGWHHVHYQLLCMGAVALHRGVKL